MRWNPRVVWSVIVLVTVTIVILVSLCVIPPWAGRGRRKSACADLDAIAMALELFRRHQGRYPTTEEGVARLTELPRAPAGHESWIPVDRWGNEFGYESDGKTYLLICFGADGLRGGTSWAADIRQSGGERPVEDDSE
jgi:general secretion pathway protein G